MTNSSRTLPSLILTLGALALAFAQSADAQQTWNYTGGTFDQIASPPFDSSDRIEGSITLASPAPTDGVVTLNDANVASYSFNVAGGSVLDESNSGFSTGTNVLIFAGGSATGWDFAVVSDAFDNLPSTPGDPAVYNFNSSTPLAEITLFSTTTGGQTFAGRSSAAGTLALAPSPAVPALAALGGLFLAGLVLVSGLRSLRSA